MDSDLAPIFGDLSQSEKLSEIKPPLAMNPKIEMDVKPKIEYINDFNKGMEIIGSMNTPFKTEIQNENFEVPYKRPKIEMEIKNEKIEPKMAIKPKI